VYHERSEHKVAPARQNLRSGHPGKAPEDHA
jgi:hypothetical protein